ncbi:transcriptional regulator MerR family [Clostridium sp. CAG:149]|nr:transcriptional regulator MerR family [Clostridium sp. CAG:149]
MRRIPGGLYASALLYQPETDDLSEVKRLSRSYQSQGYSTEGEIIFISQIDLSVTGCRDQVLYEVQLPLVPCI